MLHRHPPVKLPRAGHPAVSEYGWASPHPVVGKIGQQWKGKIIFVDQFRRTHKTEKVEFQFTRSTEHPLKKAN